MGANLDFFNQDYIKKSQIGPICPNLVQLLATVTPLCCVHVSVVPDRYIPRSSDRSDTNRYPSITSIIQTREYRSPGLRHAVFIAVLENYEPCSRLDLVWPWPWPQAWPRNWYLLIWSREFVGSKSDKSRLAKCRNRVPKRTNLWSRDYRFEIYWNLIWKSPGFVPFGANLTEFGAF